MRRAVLGAAQLWQAAGAGVAELVSIGEQGVGRAASSLAAQARATREACGAVGGTAASQAGAPSTSAWTRGWRGHDPSKPAWRRFALEAPHVKDAALTGDVLKDTKIGRALGFARDAILLSIFGGGAFATYLAVNYTTKECESVVEKWREQGGAMAMLADTVGEQYLRARRSVDETMATYSNPTSDQLLPATEVLYPPNMIRYIRTLVIDFEDTIVHSEYRRDRGWITFKRPGVQEFLSAAWNLGWEVVLYTDQDHLTAEPVMESLDPGRKYVAFRLYRDSTLYTGGIFKQGTHVRDLSRLNRDLRQVLYMTWDEKTGEMQPDNVVRVRKWEGDPNDTQLLDMIPVLQMIVQSDIPDVRETARVYRGKDLPTAFKERARAQAQAQAQVSQKRKGLLGSI